MDEKGYLLLVLHTHQPFVRHPEFEHAFEESWLFEAITESYIPLIEIFEKLIMEGVNFKITLSLTPPLVAMLADDLLQRRYLRYITERISLAEKEMQRLQAEPKLHRLAKVYYEKFSRCREVFQVRWGEDLTTAFQFLLDSGRIDILASGATHAYLPLWELYPQINALQIQLGVRQHQDRFGVKPSGFWLPECGFSAGVDQLLHDAGIKYFFLDAHGVLNGEPRPRFGVYAPIHCPSGVAAFGRDWESHNLVWLKDRGYPGDAVYQEYDSDIGFELELDYLSPFTHGQERVPTGMRYYGVGSATAREVYDPDLAFARCDEHANHFIHQCHREVERVYDSQGKKPVIVALFDTEHFGHWWHEGPTWLDLVIRKMAFDQNTVRLVTASDYLKISPTNQVVAPSISSWGYQGYSETWLMGRNHWVYPVLYEMIERLDKLLKSNPTPEPSFRDALNQYVRELLLAASSDWAFMMHAQTTHRYAEKRVTEHVQNMMSIYEQLLTERIDRPRLDRLRSKSNIFSNVDLLELYSRLRKA